MTQAHPTPRRADRSWRARGRALLVGLAAAGALQADQTVSSVDDAAASVCPVRAPFNLPSRPLPFTGAD